MKRIAIIGWITLCLVNVSRAQLSVEDIVRKYEDYQSTWSRSKVQLVCNQEKYTVGDTIFFKAYFLREDLTRIRGKQLLDVNLVNDRGQSCAQARFHVHNGLGFNQLVIPDTLQADIYHLEAHNNWMRNFDPAFYFSKKIRIVKDNELEEVPHPFLKVVPEGGKLIAGIPAKLGMYTHRAGAILKLRDERGQELGQTTASPGGTASIHFIPDEGKRYTVSVADDTVKAELPQVESDGVGLRLIRVDETRATLFITSPPNSSYRGKPLHVIVTARARVLYATTMMHKERDSLSVNTLAFPEGMVTVSLVDPSGKALAQRRFYQDQPDVIAHIQPDQVAYPTREKVNLDITITDKEGKPIAGEFSVRAVNAGLFDASPNLFQAELMLRGEVKWPYALDRSQANWKSSLDDFLIVAGEAVPWSSVLRNPVATPPFVNTNILERKGKAYDGTTRKPLPDYTQILFYLQKDQAYYQTFTTDNGSVSLALRDFYGDDEFFYLAKIPYGEVINKVDVIWETDSITLPAAPKAVNTAHPDGYATFMERKRLIEQSFKVHRNRARLPVNVKTPVAEELPEADITINLDEYMFFPTMHELIKEVVNGMYSRKSKKGDFVRVNLMPPLTGSEDPLYIIDGFATRNTAYFLSLKPSDLKTLKVVNHPQKLLPTGLLGQFGIVMVESRQGNLREPLDIDYKKVKGLDLPVNLNYFGKPAPDPLIPDFRSTLYWNPSVKTDVNGKATVEFFLSDDIGKVRIDLDGMMTGEKPFSSRQDIEVMILPSTH